MRIIIKLTNIIFFIPLLSLFLCVGEVLQAAGLLFWWYLKNEIIMYILKIVEEFLFIIYNILDGASGKI
jgi:hypothetical protein